MNRTEEGNNAMWPKLLGEIEAGGILYNMSIDFGPYEGIATFFNKAQGACSLLNNALIKDALIDTSKILHGKGAIIDIREFEAKRHITLRYVITYSYCKTGTAAGLNMVYTPSGENKGTEFYNIITHNEDDRLPESVTHFSHLPLRYKIPQEFNKDLEFALMVKYPNLFKLLNDEFEDKQKSLYINYFNAKCS